MSWSLCTKQDVLSIHPTQENVLQDFWSDAVESMIRLHLGNPSLGLTETVTDELHDGANTALLILHRPPVLSVQKVLVLGSEVSPSNYRIFPNGIELLTGYFPEGHLNVSVSYTNGSVVDPLTGISTVDPLIRLTAAAMIVAIVNYRGRAGADASIKWGQAQVKEGSPSGNSDGGLTSHLQNIMRRMLPHARIRVH